MDETADQPEFAPAAARTVVAAIDALASGALVAVDADGTLWDLDVGDELVRLVGQQPDLAAESVDVDRYFAEIAIDHALACAFTADVARTVNWDLARARLATFIGDRLRPREYLVQALRDAVARGVRVWVVSASPAQAVSVGVAAIGLSVEGLIAAGALPDRPGHPAPLPVGAGKVAAWRHAGLGRAALAIGDSDWDLPLLRAADLGVRVIAADADAAFGTLARRWRGAAA